MSTSVSFTKRREEGILPRDVYTIIPQSKITKVEVDDGSTIAKIKRIDLVSRAIDSIESKRLFGQMEINDWHGTQAARDSVRKKVAAILMEMGEVERANKFLKEVVDQTYDEECEYND